MDINSLFLFEAQINREHNVTQSILMGWKDPPSCKVTFRLGRLANRTEWNFNATVCLSVFGWCVHPGYLVKNVI